MGFRWRVGLEALRPLKVLHELQEQPHPEAGPLPVRREGALLEAYAGDVQVGEGGVLVGEELQKLEGVHDPGPITLGIFRDLGWTVNENLTSIRPRDLVEIGLFPNPATEFVTLQLGPRATPGYVTLHAADGRTVRRQPVPAGESAVRLEIAGLPAGFYTVRTGVGVGKMVVR